MKSLPMWNAACWGLLLCPATLRAAAPLPGFLVTNDDLAVPFIDTVTFYPINPDGTLGAQTSVATGGHGIAGGYFAAPRVIVRQNGSDACVYASNAGTGDIAAIDAATQTLIGNFYGAPADAGSGNGIGLAANAQYLYATYSTSSTIGTFQIGSACNLTFLGSFLAAGLNGGTVDGLAIRGSDILVVTYGDGSIESFDIANGIPVSNGDQEYSTGSNDDHLPNGVTITRDGHFAIFGDASTATTVEVADISSGKLSPTVAYNLGSPWNSGNVQLSPDGKLLFVSNDSSGQITAAFFDNTTGKVHPGCTSASLKGFYSKFSYVGNLGLQTTTLSGGVIYVPEFGSSRSYLGMLNFVPDGTTCTITEAAGSPVSAPTGTSILSIAVYPSLP